MKQSEPTLEWHETHMGALDSILDGVMVSRDFQSSNYKDKELGDKKQGPKLLANGTCYHWNRGTCEKDNCKWNHACNACMGDHKAFTCKKKDK